MSSVNVAAKEISLKIVYYGPGLGGKTSSLVYIHRTIKPEARGQLVSLATGADRTLYFDFLPVKLANLRGFAIRVQLYTVPGQVHYNSTRKLVLTGADGIVFVADSQKAREDANIESLTNLEDNLREQGVGLEKVPHLFQYNKRDVQNVLPLEGMDASLNKYKAPYFATCATTGRGVFEALKSITTLVLTDLRRRGIWRAEPPPKDLQAPKREEGAPVVEVIREEPSDPALSLRTGEGSISASLQALAERREEEPPPDLALTPLKPESLPDPPPRARLELSELLPPGAHRDQIVAVEYLVYRGDYAGAVAKAAKLFNDSAAKNPAVVSQSVGDLPALHALMLGIPGARYLRFRETASRAASGGASSADALFALFFIVDAALRAG